MMKSVAREDCTDQEMAFIDGIDRWVDENNGEYTEGRVFTSEHVQTYEIMELDANRPEQAIAYLNEFLLGKKWWVFQDPTAFTFSDGKNARWMGVGFAVRPADVAP